MSVVRYLLLALVATLLQVSVFSLLMPRQAPVFLAVLALAFALLRGRESGTEAGIFLGLWQDLLTGRLIGLHTVVYGVAGYLVGSVGEDIDLSSPVPYFVVGGVALLIERAVVFGAFRLFGLPAPLSVPLLVLPAAFGLVVLALCRWVLPPKRAHVMGVRG